MDTITLEQIEKRHQEYLQLTQLDKLLLDEIYTERARLYLSDPFRLAYAKNLTDWLIFNHEDVVRLTPLTDYVLHYDGLLKDSLSVVKNDIKSINRVIGEYQDKISNLELRLEIANQALKSLESHEDK